MAEIECTVPFLISDCTGGRSRFKLEASTIAHAIEVLLDTYPLLRIHLYTETGELREHVLLYYNDDNIAWLDRLDQQLAAGDRLTVLQAVSGG
jgi:sulfur-carrier protein